LWYDISSRESFESLGSWIKEIENNMAEDWVLYLVANKSDKSGDVEVQYEEGITFAKNNKFDYFTETSAKTGKGILDLFF
jgi:GTPase SAR1 family protein